MRAGGGRSLSCSLLVGLIYRLNFARRNYSARLRPSDCLQANGASRRWFGGVVVSARARSRPRQPARSPPTGQLVAAISSIAPGAESQGSQAGHSRGRRHWKLDQIDTGSLAGAGLQGRPSGASERANERAGERENSARSRVYELLHHRQLERGGDKEREKNPNLKHASRPREFESKRAS